MSTNPNLDVLVNGDIVEIFSSTLQRWTQATFRSYAHYPIDSNGERTGEPPTHVNVSVDGMMFTCPKWQVRKPDILSKYDCQ